MMKQIPYGITDFSRIQKENYYYVDKTMFIEKIEMQPPYLFLIRPRRFGKSLTLAMLEAYYDVNHAEQFDELFGQLYIGQHPTKLHNQFLIMRFNFSEVSSNVNEVELSFKLHCCSKLKDFVFKYEDLLGKEIWDVLDEKIQEEPGAFLSAINSYATRKKNIRIYLLIDEYDNFTNVVLNEQGNEVYHALTHASGFYREIFKKFKGMFERIFMTGVSPVTLDDLTSGFNIGWNISTDFQFNMMLGFSETDVRTMLQYYKDAGQLPADTDIEAMMLEMKPWYDNYCFAKECLKQDARVFNCDMVLYYLRQYMDSGHSPERMVDPNTKTDYNKLKKLLQLDRLDGDRRGVIRRIVEEGQIITEVEESFPAKDLTNPNIFPSLLFYYGMLTIKGTYGSQLILCIPNNNVRKQYYEYLLEGYNEYSGIRISSLLTLFTRMSFDGQWQEALQYIADAYKNLSSVRDSIEGERSIQGFFMAYLSLNDYYITAPELELSHGYCDFFLLPNLTHYQSRHSYIVELKYLPKKDFEAKAAEQWQQAVEQIDSYARAPRVEALRQGTQMHKIVMQFSGWNLMRMEEV